MMVLPLTAKINKLNHLEIGGCDTIELAKKYGTPLFVYDEETIRHQCRQYQRHFQKYPGEVEVIYGCKAFSSLATNQIILEEGLSIDISSGGELFLALASGFPAEKIFFHGNNKTPQEIELALKNKIGYIVVDNFDEMELIEESSPKNIRVKILLRITPGIKPSTHTYVQTGQEDSKFGFGLAEGIAMKAIKKSLSLKHLILKGIHMHIGSQVYALHSYAKAIEVALNFVSQIKKETGYEIEEFNVGGGLGVKYKADDEPSTIEEFAQVIIKNIISQTKKRRLKLPKLMVEPGRSIMAQAGLTLYTLGTIKHLPRLRTYISVDGGMSDNLRPMLYGSIYEAIIANKANLAPQKKVTIAGKHCESGDILIKDVKLPQIKRGDILITPVTGAYGYVMANNYNRQPRPAVVLVGKGQSQIIIRRENYEDFLRLEKPLKIKKSKIQSSNVK